MTVENTAGHLATVVAKVDHLSKVQHERRNVESFVAGALPVGAFPAIASVVEVGAGAIGGLFYQAAGFEDSLLDIIQRDPDLAAKAVDAIALHLAKWRDGGEKRRVEVGELRRHLAPDGKLLARQSAEVVAPAESVRIHAQSCVQHGDLHVFNILVADDGRPIVIDFNDTGPSFSALDAVCLELSVLMHEGAAGRTGDWPTPEEAALWPDLDSYVQRCPYRPFVVACRRWARDAAAADGEILAAAYAYAIRQLRFDGCPQPVASAIAAATSARLLQR